MKFSLNSMILTENDKSTRWIGVLNYFQFIHLTVFSGIPSCDISMKISGHYLVFTE